MSEERRCIKCGAPIRISQGMWYCKDGGHAGLWFSARVRENGGSMNEGARVVNEQDYRREVVALLEKMSATIEIIDSRLLTLEEVAEETRALRAASD